MLHRLRHGALGDGVEDDALDRRVLLDRATLPERLLEVPGDRLPLAVGVGGEDQFAVFGERVGDGFDMLFAIARDLPKHLEFVLRVDGAVFRRQVADMAVGGKDGEVLTQILVNCLSLSR